MLTLDFEGSARVCEAIAQTETAYPVSQPETIARIARGYTAIAEGFSELDKGRNERAIDLFNQVRDPQTTPKFFLHWNWRGCNQETSKKRALKLTASCKPRSKLLTLT